MVKWDCVVSEDEEMGTEVGPSRTVSMALKLPMLMVTSPSPRKGRKDLKGKGRAVEVRGLLTIKRSEC